MSLPACAQQPGSRRRDGRIARRRVLGEGVVDDICECAGRPEDGRAWVEPKGDHTVLVAVEEHVGERVADLTRGAKRAAVPAIAPDRTTPPQSAIEPTRNADGEPTHAGAERYPIRCLDQQVDVVALDGKVNDTHLPPRASRMAPRIAPNGTSARRFGRRCAARIVTRTGALPVCGGRLRCGVDGRRDGSRLRPAPLRRPPHPVVNGRQSCR